MRKLKGIDDKDIARLGKAMQVSEKGKKKLKLIGYSRAFEQKAKNNKDYKKMVGITKNLLEVL